MGCIVVITELDKSVYSNNTGIGFMYILVALVFRLFSQLASNGDWF